MSSTKDYSALPEDMKASRRWLVWRSEPGGKKPRKVPYYASGKPRKGTLDSPEDIAQLGTFDDALAAMQTGRYTGLGFATVNLFSDQAQPGAEFLVMRSRSKTRRVRNDSSRIKEAIV